MLLFWLLLAAANFAVDATNAFRWGPPQSWNAAKRDTAVGSRLRAALLLTLYRPDTVVLGSSRTKGLAGAFPAAAGKVDILPIGGLDLRELLALAPLLRAAPPRRLVLPLDFFLLNAARPAPGPGVVRTGLLFWPDLLFRHLASWPALERSWQTLSASLWPPPAAAGSDHRTALLELFLGDLERRLATDPGDLARLEALLADLRGAGTEVVLFFNPTHADLAVALAAGGQWSGAEAMKRTLAAMAGRLGVALWDFQGFYVESQLPLGPTHQAWRDLSHFLPGIGERLLRRMAGTLQGDFGRPLTPAMLEAHFAEQRRRGACYLAARPELRQELLALDAAEPRVALAAEPWFGAAAATQAASGCQPLPR